MLQHKKISVSESDAVFLGWQETISGKAIALYNITAESHPSFGSTVTVGILHDLNLQIPKRERNTGKRISKIFIKLLNGKRRRKS